MIDDAAVNLRKAEAEISIAISKISKYVGKGKGGYVGSMGEFKRLVKLYIRLQSISEEVAKGEAKIAAAALREKLRTPS